MWGRREASRLVFATTAGLALFGNIAGAAEAISAGLLSPQQKIEIAGVACTAASLSTSGPNDPTGIAATAGRAVGAWLETQQNIASRPNFVAAVVSQGITAVQGCGIRSARVLPDVAGGIAAAAVGVAPASAAAVFTAAVGALPADEHSRGPETKIAEAIDGQAAGAASASPGESSSPAATRATPAVSATVKILSGDPQASPTLPYPLPIPLPIPVP